MKLGLGLSITIVSRSAFHPLMLTPAIWLDAADAASMFTTSGGSTPVAADADPVGRWVNKAGPGYVFQQATAGNRPAYKTGILASKPVVRFAGSPVVLATTSLGLLNAVGYFHAIAVVKYGIGAGSTFKPLFFASAASGSANTRAVLGTGVSGTTYLVGGRRLDANSLVQVIGGTPADGVFVIHEGILDYASALAFLYVGGALIATSNPFQTAGVTEASDSLAMTIGGAVAGSSYFNGDLAELLIFMTPPTEQGRQALYAYLNAKWGV